MNIADRLSRRETLRILGGAVAASTLVSDEASLAAETPESRLGMVIYALGIQRRLLKAKEQTHDLFEPFIFLDYCHALGAGGIQAPLGVLAAGVCERLRTKAAEYGMFVEGIADPPFEDADVQRFESEMQTAARVGALAVRTVIFPGRRYERFRSLDEFREYARRGRLALERAAPIVERHQVHLAVENHKDQRLDERLSLLRQLDSPFIGACVDTGNSFALLEDPLTVVQALAPFAFSVHLKDQAVQECEDGFLFADVALGDGFLPLRPMVDALRTARPDVRFSLETITRDPLRVPCLAESYWPTLGDVPAQDLAGTLRTVRMNTSADLPEMGARPLDEQAAIERATIVKSLHYARTQLRL